MGNSDYRGDRRIDVTYDPALNGRVAYVTFTQRLPGRLTKGHATSLLDPDIERRIFGQSASNEVTRLNVQENIMRGGGGSLTLLSYLSFNHFGFFVKGEQYVNVNGNFKRKRILREVAFNPSHLELLDTVQAAIKDLYGVQELPVGFATFADMMRRRVN